MHEHAHAPDGRPKHGHCCKMHDHAHTFAVCPECKQLTICAKWWPISPILSALLCHFTADSLPTRSILLPQDNSHERGQCSASGLDRNHSQGFPHSRPPRPTKSADDTPNLLYGSDLKRNPGPCMCVVPLFASLRAAHFFPK